MRRKGDTVSNEPHDNYIQPDLVRAQARRDEDRQREEARRRAEEDSRRRQREESNRTRKGNR